VVRPEADMGADIGGCFQGPCKRQISTGTILSRGAYNRPLGGDLTQSGHDRWDVLDPNRMGRT